MSGFTTITPPVVGDPVRLDTFAIALINNQNYLNAQLQGALGFYNVPNGSFETDAAPNTNLAPSGWTVAIAASNSCKLETSAGNATHGKQAFSMTTPGSIPGGVVLTQSAFSICSALVPFELRWQFKSTVVGTTNSLAINWYTEAGVLVSNVVVWSNSSTNPTSWQAFVAPVTPPATAKQFQIVLTGVNSNTAGTVYWDGIEVFPIMGGQRAVLFTAGGNFVWPADCSGVLVDIMGGGGGGGGGGVSNSVSGQSPAANAGTAGGNSTFFSGTYVGRGGSGGGPGNGNNGSIGGAGSVGATLAPIINSYGIQYGSAPTNIQSGFATNGTTGAGTPTGGKGGDANNAYLFSLPIALGGSATAAANLQTGNPGTTRSPANTGQAGSGGGGGTGTNYGGGGGAQGAPGEFSRYWLPLSLLGVTTIGTSVPVVIGAGGGGGTGGTNAAVTGGTGGTGTSGFCIIYY